jgi:pyridoxal phosphate enzyme, YggS family
MKEPSTIATRLAAVKARIEQLTLEAGRPSGSVTLLPVSKTFGEDAIRQALSAGMYRFGENKAQEIRDKSRALSDAQVKWVMIGHLQTNKARDIARYAHEIQSLDRPELAEALESRLQKEGRSLDALVQVKTSTEPSKYGLDPTALKDFLEYLSTEAPNLRVQGLMTMAANDPDPQAVRACFRRLRELRDVMQSANIPGINLHRLSMGMSGDYHLAIEEGSTEVRIGSAIFGERSYTDS